jgi:drug/metabolite transporter (DMT)-like permease
VAVADLGGLGPSEGSPVTHVWTRSSLLPLLAPWLLFLGLLLLPVNRSARSWWIWLPLLFIIAAGAVIFNALTFIPSEPLEFISRAFAALGYGLAATLLLAPHLRRAHRLATIAVTFMVLGTMSLIAFALGEGSGEREDLLFSSLFFAVASLGILAALHLSAFILRSRFSPAGFSAVMLVALGVIWTLIASPFVVTAFIEAGEFAWQILPAVVLVATAASYALVLPFMLLSFISPHFKNRFLRLLHLPDSSGAPPMPGVQSQSHSMPAEF